MKYFFSESLKIFSDIILLRNIFIRFFILFFLMICFIDFKLVIFAAGILLILVFPGYLFYKLIFPVKKLTFLESGALFFVLGMSLFLIPAILSYKLELSWPVFSILWIIELVISLSILRIKRIKLFTNIYLPMERIDYLILFLFIMIASAMYFHGGHFIGDTVWHFSQIFKLAKNSKIDPYDAFWPGQKIINTYYGYNLFYVIFAFFNKITSIELRKLWDISPALLSLFINSAFYFFSVKFFKRKTFVFIALLSFYFYEFTLNWGDFKFLPYPDQIARNICLLVFFGVIFSKNDDRKVLKKTFLLLSIFLLCMCFTHLYSFVTLFYIFLFYILLSILFLKEKKEKEHIFKLGLKTLLVGSVFICLRFVLTSVFIYYVSHFWNFCIKNFKYILYLSFTLLLFFLIYLICKKYFKPFLSRNKVPGLKVKKVLYFFMFPIFIFACIELYSTINSLQYISDYVSVSRPYDFVLPDFTKYSLYIFFSIILLSLIIYQIWKTGHSNKDVKRALIFMFSCFIAVYLFKFEIVPLFFIKVVKETFVRRFFHYGLYPYLLLPVALFTLYNIIPLTKINRKHLNIFKNICILFICILVGFGIFDLFLNQTKNDWDNHDYVLLEENVFTFIRKNIPEESLIGSYGQAVQEPFLQIPNYSFVTLPFTINSPDQYPFDYLLIHNTKEKDPTFLESFVFIRRKVTLFPEIFKEIYKDNTYTLYQIDKSVDMNALEASTVKKIDQLITTNQTQEAYNQSTRLLLIKGETNEYWYLNEELRNKLYDINPEYTKLTPTFNLLTTTSIGRFHGPRYNFSALLDQDGFPSRRDQIYLTFNKLDENTKHYYVVHFNMERTLHELLFEWEKGPFMPIDFSVHAYYGDYFETLIDKRDNDKVIYHYKFEKPIKVRNLRIEVNRFQPDSKEARLQNLEIR